MAVVQHPVTKKFVNADVLAKELAAGGADARAAQAEQFREIYDIVDPGQAKPPTGGTSGVPAADLGREQPPAPKFSKHLLRRAKALGMEESDFEGWDAERLEDVLFGREHERNEATRQRLSHLEGMWTSPQSLLRDPSVPDSPQVPKGTAPASPAEEPDASEFDADTTKRLHAFLGKVIKPYQERLEKMEQLGDALGRAEQHRHNMSLAEQSDAFFVKHPEIYGDKTFKTIDRKSDEFQRRQFMVLQMKDFSDVAGTLEKLHRTVYPQPKPKDPPAPKTETPPAAQRNGDAARILAERKAEWDEHAQLPTPASRHEPEVQGRNAAIAAIEGVLTRAKTRDGESNHRQQEEAGIPE